MPWTSSPPRSRIGRLRLRARRWAHNHSVPLTELMIGTATTAIVGAAAVYVLLVLYG